RLARGVHVVDEAALAAEQPRVLEARERLPDAERSHACNCSQPGDNGAMVRLLASIVAALASTTAAAQSFPNRSVTMVVGFAPGGGTDIASRIIAKKLGDNIGQSVVVENRAGAGGNIATELVARSQPDGYTLLLASVGSLSVAPHLIAKLPYDPV